jgi:hypothetical protein
MGISLWLKEPNLIGIRSRIWRNWGSWRIRKNLFKLISITIRKYSN